MPNTYVIRIHEPNAEPNAPLELVTKAGKLYTSQSLADAIDARDDVQKWVKGNHTVCVITELTNV